VQKSLVGVHYSWTYWCAIYQCK